MFLDKLSERIDNAGLPYTKTTEDNVTEFSVELNGGAVIVGIESLEDNNPNVMIALIVKDGDFLMLGNEGCIRFVYTTEDETVEAIISTVNTFNKMVEKLVRG